ncbi:hypothetical protein THAOC_29278, partial [Thalassiosira oceanica]
LRGRQSSRRETALSRPSLLLRSASARSLQSGFNSNASGRRRKEKSHDSRKEAGQLVKGPGGFKGRRPRSSSGLPGGQLDKQEVVSRAGRSEGSRAGSGLGPPSANLCWGPMMECSSLRPLGRRAATEGGSATRAAPKGLHGLPPRQVLRRGLPEGPPQAAQEGLQAARGRDQGRAAVQSGPREAGAGLLPTLHSADSVTDDQVFNYERLLHEKDLQWM